MVVSGYDLNEGLVLVSDSLAGQVSYDLQQFAVRYYELARKRGHRISGRANARLFMRPAQRGDLFGVAARSGLGVSR